MPVPAGPIAEDQVVVADRLDVATLVRRTWATTVFRADGLRRDPTKCSASVGAGLARHEADRGLDVLAAERDPARVQRGELAEQVGDPPPRASASGSPSPETVTSPPRAETRTSEAVLDEAERLVERAGEGLDGLVRRG